MNLHELSTNTARLLSVEAIQGANSGHPGLPLGAAPMVFTLWAEHMKHNPKNPNWLNRDRFVLSAGHGSSLLYSLLHLFEYGVTIDDLKNFRQFNSATPGHPEYKHTVGVEVTTGPLGQGIANAVGMAMAEAHLAAKFNKDGYEIFNHNTFAVSGDGCLMEGVAYEAVSLAGTLGLGKLIVLWDSNKITIEGSTDLAFREDVLKRFEACGWETLVVEDANDVVAVSQAIEKAKSSTDKPTLIEVKSIIGYGAPNKQGSCSVHGSPLGNDEILAAKKFLEFNHEEPFTVPSEVREEMSNIVSRLGNEEKEWNNLYAEYKEKFPKEFEELQVWLNEDLEIDLLNDEDFWKYEGNLATRISSEQVLNKIASKVPNLFGGSADLAPSTKTVMKGKGDFSQDDYSGQNVHFGIREHAMTAIANGLYLHGGVRPYIAGFFVFSDYMKPSMRLSALMNLPVISILTHDSIGVGEDGPTHQPIEHLAALRSIPNYTVFRPCDTNETAAGWLLALTRKSPTALVLSRQDLTLQKESGKKALKGAYVMRDCEGTPDIILIASGSEVDLIYKAYDVLATKGVKARVVSMPSMEVFEEQSDEYKDSVLPKTVTKRLAVEAGSSFGWHKYLGFDGDIISMDTFGASAPAELLFESFGFSVDNVVERALKVLGK